MTEIEGLGPTSYSWRPDVLQVIRFATAHFPSAVPNTYECHPFCGDGPDGVLWEEHSVDFWGLGGRGWPINLETGRELVRFLFNLDWGPSIRHYIYRHTLWTSFGGTSRWLAGDHSGKLRHVHLTYW